MKKLICMFAALIFLDASVLWAFNTVTVNTKYKDGTQDTKIVEMQKRKVRDSWRLRIPKESIGENVSSIEVHYDYAKASKGEAGYFVMGDGRSGGFNSDSGSINERRCVMPIFGMKTPRGTFVAIVKGLKYEYSTVVNVNNGIYNMFPRFLIKYIGFPPYEDIVVDFYKLTGENANYAGMAKKYRKYQLDRGEVKPIRERIKERPQLAYTAESVFVRIKHANKHNKGIEHQTPENEPKVAVSYTFDQFMDVMRNLKALGVDKAEMCFVGFNSGGFDGRFPDIFPIEPSIGGEEKMREAVKLGKELGYQMTCHVCNTDFYTVAKRWNEDDIAVMPNGKKRTGGVLAGGRVYNPCFKQVYEKYVEEDYKGLSDIGIKGTFHIDVTSCIVPYSCNHPSHPCTRQETADYMNKIGELARKYFGGFGSEGPCDHVAKSLDYALYASAYPSWVGGKNPLVEKVLPLWQLVYHGIIVSNPFYYTIDYNIDGPRTFSPYNYISDITLRHLKLVEYGGRPTFYFQSYRDPKNLAKIKEAHDEYKQLSYLQYEFMDDHRELSPDVFLTVYSDGSEIVTNYTDKAFQYKGATVNPMDYKLFKPGN